MSDSPPISPITPYLVVRDADAAIVFYARAFGAEAVLRLADPDGTVGHAHLKAGAAEFMLADEHPDFGAIGPATLGGTPVMFHLAVDDADAATARAVDAGATLLRPVEDQFHGNRRGMVADPFGHKWILSQVIEPLSAAEMQRRYDELTAKA